MTFETGMLWAYVACMAAGALWFARWYHDPQGVPRAEYLVALLIPVWSGLAYTAMALGLGQTEVWGQTAYWARYADWIVTTPLLATALWMTASLEHEKKPWLLLGALVAADAIMILCGLVGDLSPAPARFVFFGLGVGALLVLFGLVWGPLRREAYSKGTGLGSVFDKSAGLLGLLWVGYPTLWILGPSGIGLLSQPVETALFVVLPVVSKVGWSLFDLGHLRRYVAAPPSAARPAAAARALG